MISSDFDGVVLAVPTSFGYAKHSKQSADWFVAQCLKRMLVDAGIEKSDVDGLAVSSFTMATNPVASLSRSLGMSLKWLESVPFGGASGILALRRAGRAVQNGDASIVACIGADSNPRGGFESLVSRFSMASEDAVFPYGAAGPSMPFAHMTRQYMDATGTSREDFGRLCISQRWNSSKCEHALLRSPISLSEYLEAPAIAEPLHKLDLVMPCAGADGFLVMSEDAALALRLPYARIRSLVERHNAFADDQRILRGGWARDSDVFYGLSGLRPRDIDVLATYDDFPVVVFMQLEALGFCEPGRAAEFVRDNDLTINGNLPHNTSGGQLGCGQAGAAGGYLGLVEILRQITHQASGRQVNGARIGVVAGYGMAVYDRCLATGIAMLEAA